jgi:arylsulfatase A-like enzyme
VETKARQELAGYYAHIEATDRAIGRLLAEVDLAETTVVFTSVHGDMHGSHGLWRKAWPYEESIRVPLLVRHPRPGGPKARNGRTDASPVSLVDLPHMTVAWAEGRDWRCKRDNAAVSMPAAAGLPLQCPHAWRGFRSARHKLVLRPDADGSERPWLFFDLEQDPLEMKNLVADPAKAKEVAQLRALM